MSYDPSGEVAGRTKTEEARMADMCNHKWEYYRPSDPAFYSNAQYCLRCGVDRDELRKAGE